MRPDSVTMFEFSMWQDSVGRTGQTDLERWRWVGGSGTVIRIQPVENNI